MSEFISAFILKRNETKRKAPDDESCPGLFLWGSFNFMMETGINLIKQSYEDKLK